MKNRGYCLMWVMTFFLLASCENFMDIHNEYIKEGEIIYAPKTDSIAFTAGQDRILFRFWLYNSPNVRTVDLYWNNRNDSLITPVTPSTGRDSMGIIIPGMGEQAYTFEARTTDIYGHKSLYTTGFGNSYGPQYESLLTNRRIRNVALTENGGEITWFAASDGLAGMDVRYQTHKGVTQTIRTSAKESKTLCPDVKAGSSFEIRSLFIPEEESIDTFTLAWVTPQEAFPVIFLYDRSDWEVIAVSDETASDGGGMKTLIDGDLESFWHSNWEGESTPLPHWAVIDMKSSRKIARIETYRRKGNGDSKTVEYYVGNSPDADASTWQKIGEGQFSSGDLLTMDINEAINTGQGRYLKLLLPDSNRDPFISIAEVYLYGN